MARMFAAARTLGGLLAAGALVTACATVPRSQAKRSELETAANEAKMTMLSEDPGIRPLLDQAAGYIIFPEVKQGGLVVGGAGGAGVVYEHGQRTGFAELSQASFGAQIGGQKYAELVIVRDRWNLDKIKAGSFDVGGQASAVVLRAGAAGATDFGEKGVAIVVHPIGGAMLNVSIAGQQIKYKG